MMELLRSIPGPYFLIGFFICFGVLFLFSKRIRLWGGIAMMGGGGLKLFLGLHYNKPVLFLVVALGLVLLFHIIFYFVTFHRGDPDHTGGGFFFFGSGGCGSSCGSSSCGSSCGGGCGGGCGGCG